MLLFGTLALVAVVVFCLCTKASGGFAYMMGIFAGIGTVVDVVNEASYSSIGELPAIIKNYAPEEILGAAATFSLLAVGYIRTRWPR